MSFPKNLRYTKEHEWVRQEEGNIFIVGITDYAQRELGDIVYVEVETIGKTMEAGEVFGTVEAVKTVSDLFLPVSGTITELNPELANAPDLVNTDPYGKGWMIKLTVKDPATGCKSVGCSCLRIPGWRIMEAVAFNLKHCNFGITRNI